MLPNSAAPVVKADQECDTPPVREYKEYRERWPLRANRKHLDVNVVQMSINLEEDDEDKEVGYQLTQEQRSMLLDAVMRVCPRVVQSLPLPRERSHESSKRREQRAKARALAISPGGGAMSLPSPMSVGSPGARSLADSSQAADSPSSCLNGQPRWPIQRQPPSRGPSSASKLNHQTQWAPTSATYREGHNTWPPAPDVEDDDYGDYDDDGAAHDAYEDGEEPRSPVREDANGDDADTPSPRSPGDATRWLLQLSAGRGA